MDCLSERWPAMGGTRRVVATASHGKGEGRGEMMGPAASAAAETTSHKSLDATSDDWTVGKTRERKKKSGSNGGTGGERGWWDLEQGGGGLANIRPGGWWGGREGMAGR